MASTTINRPSGALSNNARVPRYGDANTRSNGDDIVSQGSTLGQGFGSNAFAVSRDIWGFANSNKRDTSRSHVTNNDGYAGTSGSGALAASSEVDLPYLSRNGSWAVDNTSPTMTASGTTSPVRHRGSGPLPLPDASPYLTTSRPAIGQGPGVANNRTQGKSSLDPASGPFKYPLFSKVSPFAFPDDKENGHHISGTGQVVDAYSFDQRGFQLNGATTREGSGPPSRHSETGSSGTANGSFFANGQYPSFGHTPSNSVQFPRPSTQGRTPSFPSSTSGRSYTELTNPIQEAGASLNRAKNSQNGNHDNSDELSYQSSGLYQNHNSQPSLNGLSAVWGNGQASTKNFNTFVSDNYAEGAFVDQINQSKPPKYNDRGSVSPGNDYRHQPNSPNYYPVSDVSSNDLDPAYLRALRPQSAADLERGFQRLQFTQQYFPQQLMFNGQFQGQYTPHLYDYPPQQNFRLNSHQFGYQLPAPPYTPARVIPRGPAREQDDGHGVRSVLLEEFRCNAKSSRRYELKDIYNHVVEFSGDQHGSRFIQQKLETANSDEKDRIFREIQPNALQLMTDVFGNYVIQKLFEHGNQVQKRVLAEQMKNHVPELSVQMYGCRVVQKALEHVLADQQAELVRELKQDILKCVKDQNGNHVIQKAIERVPAEDIQFIIEAFKGQVHTLATHPYGCRVIQRMLEYCSEKDQAAVLEELHVCSTMLITDQYGNYVMQHVIAQGKPEDRAKIIKIVTAQLLTLSKHKFASNVVEKTIQFGSDEQRRAIVAQLTTLHSDGSSPLQLMMKDQYGNYVIQKLLAQLKGDERERFIEDMKPQLTSLKKYNYGKQITAIEKLISTGPQTSSTSCINNNEAATDTQTMPLDINSSMPTPMLTMEQNSPESSSLPSTNASTVDGPTKPSAAKSAMTEQGRPEVRIETVQ